MAKLSVPAEWIFVQSRPLKHLNMSDRPEKKASGKVDQ